MDALVKQSDFNNICRLCLGEDNLLMCLFSRGQDEIPLYLIARTCTAVDIDEEDGLPPNICCACRDTILSCYQFRQQVSRNDTILRCIAGMKQDPDFERLKKVAGNREMMNRPPWTAVPAGDVSSKLAKPYDAEVSLNYMFSTNSRIDKMEEIHSGTDDAANSSYVGQNIGSSNQADKDKAVSNEEISPEQNNYKSKVKSFGNTPRRFKNKARNSDTDCDAVRAKALEYGQTVNGGFCCTPCQKVYRSTYKFYSHIKFQHLLMGGFMCNQCRCRFQFKHQIGRHIKEEHLGIMRNRKYYVSEEVRAKGLECGKRFAGGFYCNPCEKFYPLAREYYNHIQLSHIQFGEYQPTSPLGQRIETKKTNNQQSHNFVVIEEVRAKMFEYGTRNPDGNYYCRPCERFFKKAAYYSHVRNYHLQIRDFTCDQCGYQAKSKTLLVQHIDGIHLRVKKYKCSICPLRFYTKAKLNIHARQHQPGGISTCSKIQSRRGSRPQKTNQNSTASVEVRAKMIEYGVPNGDSYYCKLCQKFYPKGPQYINHIKFTHLQIRDFMCDHCGYRAFSKANLIQHIDGIHLRVKKYKCLDCPLRFCTKKNLNIHARTHRPGAVKTSMCEVCGKSLTTRRDLLRHLRAQHFPELKIKCEFCDCRYASPNKLRDHVKKLH